MDEDRVVVVPMRGKSKKTEVEAGKERRNVGLGSVLIMEALGEAYQ